MEVLYQKIVTYVDFVWFCRPTAFLSVWCQVDLSRASLPPSLHPTSILFKHLCRYSTSFSRETDIGLTAKLFVMATGENFANIAVFLEKRLRTPEETPGASAEHSLGNAALREGDKTVNDNNACHSFIHSIIHSFSSQSYDRPVASSKAVFCTGCYLVLPLSLCSIFSFP
jgi:hypothetical protein